MDEGDELTPKHSDVLARPSFFQAISLTVKTKKQPVKGNIGSPIKKSPQVKLASKTARISDEPVPMHQLANSTSSPGKLSIKQLKQQQMNLTKPSIRKPPVPSHSVTTKQGNAVPANNSTESSAQLTGLRSTRGLTSTAKLDLKPIDHTSMKKFKPHPNCYEKFRTKLPKAPAKRDLSDSMQMKTMTSTSKTAISPYQMMLDEMKKNELENETGIARPMIKDLEDSLEFKAGEMTAEDKDDLRASYLAFEERLENLM